ncbi:MAG TPA: hypothetical protein VML36_02945 [Nitrospiria bacterium]|nr:hypothetical protein [Nitrospiria bacterium]
MEERRRAERRVKNRGYADDRRQSRGQSYAGLDRRVSQRRIQDRRVRDRRADPLDTPS